MTAVDDIQNVGTVGQRQGLYRRGAVLLISDPLEARNDILSPKMCIERTLPIL